MNDRELAAYRARDRAARIARREAAADRAWEVAYRRQLIGKLTDALRYIDATVPNDPRTGMAPADRRDEWATAARHYCAVLNTIHHLADGLPADD